MESPFSLPAVLTPSLTGRDAVIDALYRCVMAFDTADAALFDSSFLQDGVFEVNGRAMRGLPEIHATGLALIFKLETTHMATNVRVHMRETTEEEKSEATLTTTVLSQHFVEGKGMELGQKSLMSGSLYRGELVRDETGLWKFKHLQIRSTWVDGDWSVMAGGGEFSEMGQ